MTHFLRSTSFALLLAVVVFGCDSNEPGGGAGEGELITDLVLTLTNTANASDVVTLEVRDPDADGVFNAPTVSGPFTAGATYAGEIEVLGLVDGEDEDITEEIKAEAEEHLFAYSSTVAGLTITRTDRESDYTTNTGSDLEVGLEIRVQTGAAGTGTFRAILYHFDEAPKTDNTATSDEKDIDQTWTIRVQ